MEVFDHSFSGPLFTWSNNQAANYISKKLDRILVNSHWHVMFPSSFVEVLSPGCSDHCPCLLTIGSDSLSLPKPFRFFNFWTLHCDFLSIVGNSWDSVCQGTPFQVLFRKLKRLKHPLKDLNTREFSDLSERVKRKNSELQMAQLELLNRFDLNTFNGVQTLKEELSFLETAERELYKQKAKVQWLCEGDLCTSFFFRMVKIRNNKRTIRFLINENGTRLDTLEDISNELVNHFRAIFGTGADESVEMPVNTIRGLLNYLCPDELHPGLVRDITRAEVKEAFFAQGIDKAPGADGYTAKFFKSTWHIIHNDVYEAFRSFFHGETIPEGFASTVITLVPKTPNPTHAKDYRPIACCSVVYKSITRILMNRISPILPHLINRNQSAFIKGRSISDNILLAQELVRKYGVSSISPRCTMKIDISKAFDSVSWNFILSMLAALNLPPTFITWIKCCITSPNFTLLINGSMHGYFHGGRGVKQGDPLSPILFVISMNVLSCLLDAAASNNLFQYHPKCLRIKLTHLCFADDLMIFTKANIDSISGVYGVLEYFYSHSGLKLNPSKSELFLSGIPDDQIREIKEATGFKISSLPVRYLGIPLVPRKLTEKDCRPLLDKVKARITNWASRKLSYAGRILLIQSVIYSITSFWCRHFFLPKVVLKKINQLCMRYFWSGNDMDKPSARVAWSQVCSPKSEGGLSLKNLGEWNQACLIHLASRILHQEESPWIDWIHCYVLHKEGFWHINANSSMSWTFKKLLTLRPLIARCSSSLVLTSSVPSIAKVWLASRMVLRNVSVVSWHRLTWFPMHIPKHSIISWMMILDRLPTKVRLASWGLNIDTLCTLCGLQIEDRNHLFMECPFTSLVWKSILQECNICRPCTSWDSEFRWIIANLKGKSLIVLILKLAWCCLNHSIWRERNTRIFQNVSSDTDHIMQETRGAVSAKLSGKKINILDPANVTLCNRWGIIISTSP